jgi:hypothetical protein
VSFLKVFLRTVEEVQDHTDRCDNIHGSRVDLQPCPSRTDKVRAKNGGQVGEGHLVNGRVGSHS